MSPRQRTLAALLVPALGLSLALAPRAADACGSDGGGGGSSGGGSGGGGSSSGSSGGGGSASSSGDSEPACVQTTDIVGRAECSHFGAWDVESYPRLQLTVGSSFHAFSLDGYGFSGTARHDEDIAYRLTGEDLGTPTALGGTFDVRVTGLVGDHVYVGGEGRIGGAALSRSGRMSQGELTLTPSSGLLASIGGVAGVEVPLGDFTARGEVFAGYRFLGLSVATEHGTCESSSLAWDGDPLLQTRLSLSRWITPWVSAGASVGSDPFHREDLSVGLFLGGHFRAFDAQRSR